MRSHLENYNCVVNVLYQKVSKFFKTPSYMDTRYMSVGTLHRNEFGRHDMYEYLYHSAHDSTVYSYPISVQEQ